MVGFLYTYCKVVSLMNGFTLDIGSCKTQPYITGNIFNFGWFWFGRTRISWNLYYDVSPVLPLQGTSMMGVIVRWPKTDIRLLVFRTNLLSLMETDFKILYWFAWFPKLQYCPHILWSELGKYHVNFLNFIETIPHSWWWVPTS